MKNKSTNPKNGLWTASYGEIGATLKALQDNGVTLEHLARLRSDTKYARRIAEYIIHDYMNDLIRHNLASAIMGNNFFGIEDWTALLFGTDASKKKFHSVPAFPWNEAILTSICPLCGKVVKNCHFAFLGLDCINGQPLTILKLQELHPATGQPKFSSYAPSQHHEKKFVAETTMNFGWHLLHIEAVPGSENKTFEEQKEMLPKEYEVPLLIAEITKDLLFFKKTGIYANPSGYTRCADINPHGDRVLTMYFDADGLDFVDIFNDLARRNNIYVAASRKPGV